MSGACANIPVATAAANLAAHAQAAAVRFAADLALDSNRTIVIVGRTSEDAIVFCSTACCLHRMGTVVVAPDIDMLLWAGVPEGAQLMQRNDGRTAYVLEGARTWQEVAHLSWPEASWVLGEGRYATVRACGASDLTVLLHLTEEQARAALRGMHFGGIPACTSGHDIVVLGGPTDG